MVRTHEKAVEAQFGSRAKAYVDSTVHSQGADLDALDSIVRNSAPTRALDLGTGGGHVSYLMARQAKAVVAVDLSNEMIAAVARTASERGLGNIETVAAPAENLPFEDGGFDFLACRYSAHHWRDFDGGLREASRVLKRGSTAVFIDVYSPGPALFDTHLQAVELLRDTSHVRDYTMSEWITALARSGFAPVGYQTWKLRMDFPTWTARMGTSEQNARAIRTLCRRRLPRRSRRTLRSKTMALSCSMFS